MVAASQPVANTSRGIPEAPPGGPDVTCEKFLELLRWMKSPGPESMRGSCVTVAVSQGRACSCLIAGDEETTHWPNCPGFVQCWLWQLSYRAQRADEECTSLQLHPGSLIHPRQKGPDSTATPSSTPRHSLPTGHRTSLVLSHFSTRDLHPETQPTSLQQSHHIPGPKIQFTAAGCDWPKQWKHGLVLAA